MKVKVKIEDVDLVIHEGSWNTSKQTSKVGVLPDDFDDHELLFDHEIDQTVYYWFTESEFKEVVDMQSKNELFPLDDGVFIYSMTNADQPFDITL